MSENQNQIAEAVVAFVNALTWDETKRLVEERRDLLLTDTAERFLTNLVAQYQGVESATHTIEEHRALLARCRQQGIDAAFARYLQPSAATPKYELRTLLQELSRPSTPGEILRRIAVCREALAMVDGHQQPELWATLQIELGNSLLQNPQGDRAEDVEEAIRRFGLALEVHTREGFPVDWALTQSNLGNAYAQRMLGERAENLEQAIDHYELALEVRTREGFPVQWAVIQNDLAIAYLQRMLGERAENLEEAIDHYELALEVYTREGFPVDWAMTQDNLALAYQERMLGERAENLEQAIDHYELALEVRTPNALPRDCRVTAYRLGLLLYGEGASQTPAQLLRWRMRPQRRCAGRSGARAPSASWRKKTLTFMLVWCTVAS
jgi:tetratricopeptide (TPR) repeat protein